MKMLNKSNMLLVLYTSFLALCSISVILMPIATIIKDRTNVLLIVNGTVFWLSLILVITVAIVTTNCRKQDNGFMGKYPNYKKVGFLNFFMNKEAKIIDISMITALALFVLTAVFNINVYICFVFLGCFVFLLGMHCMLNDINYIYLKQDERNKAK